jgi:phytanoyl-CoA hydroxylase
MLRKLYWSARSLFASPPPAQPEYYSRFGGLWTDRRDALAVLGRKAAQDPAVAALQGKLKFFIENGYVILEGAVPLDAIDAYRAELQAAFEADNTPLLASVPVQGPQDKDVVPLAQADLDAPLTKVLDTYAHLPSALRLSFADPLVRFLSTVFEDGILAFQGLHFERGSTQAVHQDTAYVVLENPMSLCASWVALEDVQPGSGELMYYAGSHRLPDWLYSGAYKHYNHERDKHEEHMAHLKALVDRSEEQGLKLKTFLPKKGDALIWSADLAHGGSQIGDPSLTRRSLVTHYTDASTKPYYFRFLPAERQKTVEVKPGCAYTTMYY